MRLLRRWFLAWQALFHLIHHYLVIWTTVLTRCSANRIAESERLCTCISTRSRRRWYARFRHSGKLGQLTNRKSGQASRKKTFSLSWQSNWYPTFFLSLLKNLVADLLDGSRRSKTRLQSEMPHNNIVYTYIFFHALAFYPTICRWVFDATAETGSHFVDILTRQHPLHDRRTHMSLQAFS